MQPILDLFFVLSPDGFQVVERSLGVPIDQIFSEWHETPIGAASIGQVHRARLREVVMINGVKHCVLVGCKLFYAMVLRLPF